MKPKTDGNKIQLFVIQPVYKVENKTIKGEDGQKVTLERDIFIKEAFTKSWFNKNSITPYKEYVGSKGQIVKSRCKIFDLASNSWYIVGHTLNELHIAIKEIGDKVGFK